MTSTHPETVAPYAELPKETVLSRLSDRKWRLNNLYFVKDEKGNRVRFVMNPVQEYVHDNLWFFTIFPKARQLGLTTFFCMLYLDQILFSKNKSAVIIAHTIPDMKKIFRNKIKFALDNLPDWLRDQIGPPDTDNANMLVFANGSQIEVATSNRGGTSQFLHISEFGPICQKDPAKAEEIVRGAINSVHAGQFVSIESTAAGREGYFYDFCQDAERMRREKVQLTELDFKIFFFPWWIDDRYQMPNETFLIAKEWVSYFQMLKDKYRIDLTDAQKRWYIKKQKMNKEGMWSEYPSTFDEAFQVSTEGAYYRKEMERVFSQQRIRTVPHDPTLKVDTWWDLGINDDCVITFTQTKGGQIRFLDMYVGNGEGLAHYVGEVDERRKAHGYRYGNHHFPWDVDTKDVGSGLTRKETLGQLGLTGIRVAPKAGVIDGIERVRLLFSRFVFDEANCQRLVDALTNYKKEWDARLGAFKDKPKHDSNSHIADTVRVLGLLWQDDSSVEYDDDGNEVEPRDSSQSFFG